MSIFAGIKPRSHRFNFSFLNFSLQAFLDLITLIYIPILFIHILVYSFPRGTNIKIFKIIYFSNVISLPFSMLFFKNFFTLLPTFIYLFYFILFSEDRRRMRIVCIYFKDFMRISKETLSKLHNSK